MFTDVDLADPLFHLHNAPLASSAGLFCLFFLWAQKAPEGVKWRIFSGADVLCVCTESLYLIPVVDDIFPPALSPHPPLLTHPPVP